MPKSEELPVRKRKELIKKNTSPKQSERGEKHASNIRKGGDKFCSARIVGGEKTHPTKSTAAWGKQGGGKGEVSTLTEKRKSVVHF